MQTQKIAFSDTRSFHSFFLDYIDKKDCLNDFYHRFPVIDNFSQQIAEKSGAFSTATREILVGELTRQYNGLNLNEKVSTNIKSLASQNTFTVTTGHQLNIFTGPLYLIYKIVTVINTCKALKEHYPEFNFVPVYWMASEDHDYDEVKSFRLYGKKYIWETDQTGAVGRFDPKSLSRLIDELPGDVSIFKKAYTKSKTLSDAVRIYINELFSIEGLVIIDADSRALKSLFTTVIFDDLFSHSSKKLVEEKNYQLESLGYHPQVFAREVNFFYLDKNVRQRIEKKENEFVAIDTALKFTSEEIKRLIAEEPEKFSPNVILRPLYQEIILPNLAYVGGPSEVVYWLQLKGVFDYFKTPFPILMPRNFAAVMDGPTKRKFDKTGLAVEDLFEDKNRLFNRWMIKNSSATLSLEKEIATTEAAFKTVKEYASNIDVTLNKHVEAKLAKVVSSLQGIEQKMRRAEKRKHADKLRQVEAVKDYLFPNGSPQERTDNFLNFFQQDPQFMQKLLKCFDPLDFKFNVLLP